MLDSVLDENGDIKSELLERAKKLTSQIAELCVDEEPLIVMFVLEAAMTAHISFFQPSLGDLFSAMMEDYKRKASTVIKLLEALEDSE
jgi:hypothetical protein